MRSSSPKHHMTGLTLLPTHQIGSLNLTKWKIQEYGVSYPTTLYLRLEKKESNTRLIVSQMAAIQFCQTKTALQYVHVEGGFFYTKGGRRGEKDAFRENIYEEDPTPWVYVKYNIFPRIRQGCLEEKLLINLGMTQHIIRERVLFFYQLL